ncbi:hypothetical protein BV20DRAFT_1055335 [Pilatotrama ljubarskyi]|nr:hypothetical protein BV20DRAFT_1055335 [Pilatotrama ljubarskyi]
MRSTADSVGAYISLSAPLLNYEMGSIIVVNETEGPMYVFVSSYSNDTGDDDWYNIGPRKRDSWDRDGWELVAFKNQDDTWRAGVYVPTDTTVTYRGLNDITWK